VPHEEVLREFLDQVDSLPACLSTVFWVQAVAGNQYDRNPGSGGNIKPGGTGTITCNKGRKDEVSVKFTVLNKGEEVGGLSTEKSANIG
jgi:hypothetical protein